ncbi:MAG TPA: substrate-binding domain-containing protein [Vicinamibacterales bacterium]|nr:substrate-binding domain-containing protein [Vicinamibacterales bacterium]
MTSGRWRVGRRRAAGALVLAIVLMQSAIASAERITVLCSNGFKAVLQEVAPQFEKATKHQVAIGYSVSAELKRRIEGGERFDVAILTPGLMDEMIKGGHVTPSSRAVLARSPMALAVRRGGAKPDVRTVDSLKASLLASRSIAFAKEGSGGVYLMGLLKRLGIFDKMTPKFKPTTTGDDVSKAVAAGEAELGVLPLSEILPVPGVELAGTFPKEVQDYSVMVGAASASSSQSPAVKALMEFLTSRGINSVIEKKGMERSK